MVKSRHLKKKCNASNQNDDKSNFLIGLISEKPSSSNRSKRSRNKSADQQESQEGVGEKESHRILGRNAQEKKHPAHNSKSRKKIIKNETGKQRFNRLNTKREQNKRKSQDVPEEIMAERRKIRNEHSRQRVLKETAEQRQKRLEYMRERQKLRIKSETAEQRSERLKKMRAYQAKVTTSDDVLERMRERQKEKLKTETLEERTHRLEKMKLYQRSRPRKRRKKVPKKTSKVEVKSIHKENDDIAQGPNNNQDNRIPTGAAAEDPYQPFKVRRYGRIYIKHEEKPEGGGREEEDPLRPDVSMDDPSPANMSG